METTIRIDGRDVRFRSTAATPLLYRQRFNRDLLRDLESLAAEMHGKADGKTDLPVRVLTTFECMAYIMAKQADPDTVPDTPEEWLDGFSVMPFYAIMPMLLDLWSGNVTGLEESKKKRSCGSGAYNGSPPPAGGPARGPPRRLRPADHRYAQRHVCRG